MIKAPPRPKGKKRLAIFIDAANIFYSQKTLGWKVDYKKFLDYWRTKGRIMVLKAKEFDIAVLASGDSDFEPAIEYLRSIKKKIIVISARGHIARELVRKANEYVPLEKLKNDIMRI